MSNFVSLAQTVLKIDFYVRHFGFKMASLDTLCNILVTYWWSCTFKSNLMFLAAHV